MLASTMASEPSSQRQLSVALRLTLDRFDLEVDFELSAGVTAFFGPSGSGKTSLLETLVGLRRSATGHIRLGSETWLDSQRRIFVPPELRWIGYVPQEGLLFPHWNVRQNLLAGARRAAPAAGPHGTSLHSVAALLELEPLLHRSVTTLSGGERQRVALGRALCSGPRLLLLDEPLAALDLPLRRRLLPFLRRVREELTVPMILVSHDPVEVQALCDEVIVFREGQAIARGRPRQVLADPAIFAPLGDEGAEGHFENLLPGQLLRRDGGARIVCLDADGGAPAVEIHAGPGEQPAEGPVLLGISADDILIAVEPPRGLSAQNVLPAKITGAAARGGRSFVHLRLAAGVPEVVVEVTDGAADRLGLEPGRSVHLVAKATACRLYSATPPPA